MQLDVSLDADASENVMLVHTLFRVVNPWCEEITQLGKGFVGLSVSGELCFNEVVHPNGAWRANELADG